MNKILLVIKREYTTRVRNKTFLLSTFLLPIIMVLFIAGSVFISMKSFEKNTLVIGTDPLKYTDILMADSSKAIRFVTDVSVDSNNFETKGYNGIVYLPDSGKSKVLLVSKKNIGIATQEALERTLQKALETRLLSQKGINQQTLDSVRKQSENFFSISNQVKKEGGRNEQRSAGLAYGVGFSAGILLYFMMFIFGAMVMRGVMEEKTNRIAEVMISSIKPYQLMMGKIIGIAAVGLTQFLLWIVLIAGINIIATAFVSPEAMHQFQQVAGQSQGMPGNNTSMAVQFLQAKNSFLSGVPWPKIIICFLMYFLGGYLFYASLFAAVGSVVNEDPQEAQQLMLPISMPIVFAFIIMSSNIGNPDSGLMFWGSMIPFTSPIIMMGRVAYDVPWWQIGLSFALLVGGFIFTTWFAAKVYRTGILLYGKKVSWKEMIRWFFRKS
jgi:ABC-2 type transport system permease protein